jgi:MFS family permease
MFDLTRKQWLVLFAAWLGWGFDVFDALIFGYVAPNCVPTLLGLEIGSQAAKDATFHWTGILTSMLLIGWAVGGVLFGLVCDRIGRVRTMMLTMLVYSLGTAACAMAPNLESLIAFRVIASLGIGGEWAAGASMVAESMPENRRVEAGALLYTASPMGLFLATFVNFQIAGVWLPGTPETSWRYIFLFGLIPAAIAFVVRLFVQEPEAWTHSTHSQPTHSQPTKLLELFSAQQLRTVVVGASLATISLLTWWSCNAFIPSVVSGWAQTEAQARGLIGQAVSLLTEEWKFRATFWFNLGGLIGTLLTIPFAKRLGRRLMFGSYFVLSAASILLTFGIDIAAEDRVYFYFLIGLFVYGVAGAFSFYLPEIFPTRLRASGAGFCFNIGRILAAAGPIIVGNIAAQGRSLEALFYVGFIPLTALLVLPFAVETKGRALRA